MTPTTLPSAEAALTPVRLLSLASIFLCFSGCVFTRQFIATLQPTSGFLALEADSRVLYEPGSEDFAREVARFLPYTIALVEEAHYRPFPRPVEVFICGTKKSFSHFTGEPEVVRGAVTVKHLFLSAERLKELKGNYLRAVLAHELSHLHFQQYMGGYAYSAKVPAWFQEGMAEFVSGGAGMERVTRAEAVRAILQGRSIRPETRGSFFFPKRWSAYGLHPQMFYRQSWMFVRYLQERDARGFEIFVGAMLDGRDFRNSFETAFALTLQQAWKDFITGLRQSPGR